MQMYVNVWTVQKKKRKVNNEKDYILVNFTDVSTQLGTFED